MILKTHVLRSGAFGWWPDPEDAVPSVECAKQLSVVSQEGDTFKVRHLQCDLERMSLFPALPFHLSAFWMPWHKHLSFVLALLWCHLDSWECQRWTGTSETVSQIKTLFPDTVIVGYCVPAKIKWLRHLPMHVIKWALLWHQYIAKIS